MTTLKPDRSLVTNTKLRRLLQKEAMRRHATRLPYSPVEIYVDPCTACNLRCTFCPQSNWGERKRGMMEWELYERVLAEVIELRPKRIYLFCYGESLLNERIFDMVRAAVDAGLDVLIHTNAKNLDAERSGRLLDSGLTDLHFSFDTADRDEYNRMRVRSDFDVVLANIRRFLDLKRERGCEHPNVFVQELIPYRPGATPETSPAYRALFDSYDVVFEPRFMHNFAGTSNEEQFAARRAEGRSVCTQIYSRIVVTWDGKVHACCLDAEGYNIVGDLARGDTIASAWNGEAMQDLRRRTSARQLEGLKPCDRCDVLNRKPKKLPTGLKRVLGEALWRAHAHGGGDDEGSQAEQPLEPRELESRR